LQRPKPEGLSREGGKESISKVAKTIQRRREKIRRGRGPLGGKKTEYGGYLRKAKILKHSTNEDKVCTS